MTALARLPALAALCLALSMTLLSACAKTSEEDGRAPVLAETHRESGPPMITNDSLNLRNGTKLPLRAWLPAEETPLRGSLLALHGFNDHAGAYEVTGPALAAQGWAVYAPDQRGFGRTAERGRWVGVDTLVEDIREALALLAKTYPDRPLYLMGESMGGGLAIASLTGNDLAARAAAARVSGVILSAPAVWARETMPWHYRTALWLSSHLFPWMRLTGKGLDLYPSDNIPMLRRIGIDPLWIRATRIDAMAGVSDVMDRAHDQADGLTVPSLLLYGLNDQIIPARPVRDVARRLDALGPDHRLAIYPEGWHLLSRGLEGPKVIGDIARWLDDQSAPLPSGADQNAAAFLSGDLKSSEERGDHQSPWTRWNALTEEARKKIEAQQEKLENDQVRDQP
ncbi:alpha/beta hydrolase [Rhodospirillum sp. A1_3_36]|uniref:alpha/beta hydrolase n=1 Tax=Rhodospirillum sp. A1_3_36 TaxID=3391666 RepID=UPI0039A6B70D